MEPEATRVVAGERRTQCFQAPGKHQELEGKIYQDLGCVLN